MLVYQKVSPQMYQSQVASADQQAQVAINEIAQGPAGSSSQQKCPRMFQDGSSQ